MMQAAHGTFACDLILSVRQFKRVSLYLMPNNYGRTMAALGQFIGIVHSRVIPAQARE
jgi:flagellar biosynthesis/type III secretory pathway protein FliH